jgi:hypothetical protein
VSVTGFVDMFSLPSSEEAEKAEQEHAQPAWFGPPEGELGVCVPVSIVVGRSQSSVVALRQVIAFSNGLEFYLFVVARGLRDRAAHSLMSEQHLADPAELPDGFLRVGLELADGSRVSNLAGHRHRWQQETEPDGPLFFPHGGGGGSAGGGRLAMNPAYWLWPLPLAGSLRLFVEWPLLEIPLSSVDLEVNAILEAAARSESLWTS